MLECDGVEPMLYPLARKDLVHQGPRYVVQVGDKVGQSRHFVVICCVMSVRVRHVPLTRVIGFVGNLELLSDVPDAQTPKYA